MASGGRRAQSGPRPDPNSAKSKRLGLTFETLDENGYDGDAPEWPLWKDPTDAERDRWETIWCSPQAAKWIGQRWRWEQIAMYVRYAVACELDGPATSAAVLSAVFRLADQIGMTPAGLKDNGWQIGEPLASADSPSRPPALTALPGGKAKA